LHRKKPITSAVRVKHIAKRRQINLPLRTRTKRVVRQAAAIIEEAEAPEQAQNALRQAASVLDRAAQKGIIHRRTAARKKSRLARRLRAVATS